MTYILFAIFLALLPFCPLWVGIYRPQTNSTFVYHCSLFELVFYNVKLKKDGERVRLLSYSYVAKKYEEQMGV